MEEDKSEALDVSMNSAASDEDMFASSEEDGRTDMEISAERAGSSKTECKGSLPKLDLLSEDTTWRGTPLNKLQKNTSKDQYPPVAAGAHHSVLFKLSVRPGEVPKPWPDKPVDMWDQNHVRMPHSASSLYPVTPTELQRRWELVQKSFSKTISNSHQLEAAILHYNSNYSDRWDFQALHSFFSKVLEELETKYFFMKVLPKIIELALSLPTLLTNGVPLLRQHMTHSISLSQQQVSCLLANAFLCTFPRRNTAKKNSEYSSFPGINFNKLFHGDWAESKGRITSLHEKLKCLVNYFRRVTTKVPDGVVTYSRHYIPPEKLPEWSTETARLPNMYISSSGMIEDEGTGMLQMDFANKFVGGGVLGRGCVQEEIRFVICPELILSRLFTEVLDDTEALIITGCERFNTYQGYAETFEWDGNIEDSTPRDSYGRRLCSIVAIDAFRFPSAKTQYTAANINRELNKAYAGFSWGASSDCKESVATGNWGCGAYRGDACLKSLLQLMAAARTGRDLAYFTFGDEELRDKVADMHSFLVKRQVTVGDLWKVITSYNPALYRHSLYDHIYRTVTTGSIPEPLKTFGTRPFKKARVQESSPSNGTRKPDSRVNNGHKLSTDEIEKALDNIEDTVDESESKTVEAKTLNIHNDKELCLKRLFSSWTNLNESKKDFDSSECASTSESSAVVQPADTEGQSVSSSKRSSSINRKKKISDYFQTVSKS